MDQYKKKTALSFALVGLVIVAGVICSICLGKYPITMADILALITGGEVKDMTRKVFFTLRVPRTVMAALCGAGLGLAGAVYQYIFKNPLASPDIIGISSGANLGAAIAIVTADGAMVSVAIGVGMRASVVFRGSSVSV